MLLVVVVSLYNILYNCSPRLPIGDLTLTTVELADNTSVSLAESCAIVQGFLTVKILR